MTAVPGGPGAALRPTRAGSRTSAVAWSALLVGAAMVVAPLAPPASGQPAGVGVVPAVAPVGAPEAGPVSDPFPDAPRPVAARGTPPAVAPGFPVRLQVAVLGVDAPVVPVDGGADGALAVPPDPAVVGWWRAGAAPGSAAGTVVLAGHVDTWVDGPGALFHLAALRPGDRVVVATTAPGPAIYVVAAVRRYPKAELPTDVFATTGTPRLVLVTCGGVFDRRTRHYADNVVVYALPQP